MSCTVYKRHYTRVSYDTLQHTTVHYTISDKEVIVDLVLIYYLVDLVYIQYIYGERGKCIFEEAVLNRCAALTHPINTRIPGTLKLILDNPVYLQNKPLK